MLPAGVYRALYETAQSVKDGDIVEVGTAHGAGTIALATGLRSGHVHTIDKIEGGSRDAFGTLDTNKKIIEGNFKAFNVADKITLHIGTSKDIAPKLQNLKIGLLMLDADGAIDRDFRLFYDRLLPGAPVILDDYQPDFVRVYNEGRRVRMDQKRRLTALLADYFVSKGYLEQRRIVEHTWFGIKPLNAPSITDINDEDIYDLYRRLIFSSGAAHGRAAEFINTITKKFPTLHRALKNTYLTLKK